MDPVKEAFSRAKQDIQEIKEQLVQLFQEIDEIKKSLSIQTNQQIDRQTAPSIQTNQQKYPTDILNEQVNMPLKAVITPISTFSTGNRGVPTDRQTNQQTDNKQPNTYEIGSANHFHKVSELLDSLDSIKKEVRLKFKKLTKQEMLVFATIYQLEDQGFIIDYPSISSKLNLSESSIRDYVQRIIKKGVPLDKIKENNKKVTLSISKDLKKIASLSTIMRLREI